jgi:hypothetical protein
VRDTTLASKSSWSRRKCKVTTPPNSLLAETNLEFDSFYCHAWSRAAAALVEDRGLGMSTGNPFARSRDLSEVKTGEKKYEG